MLDDKRPSAPQPTKAPLWVLPWLLACLSGPVHAEVFDQIDYARIDDQVTKTPDSAETSVETLAAHLVTPARNDLERAWSIFRWMADNVTYDVESLLAGHMPASDSQSVLERRSSVCEGYANLFAALAKAAGLEVVKITGHAKGYGYAVGGDDTQPSNHAWNAVRIDGRWRLIDATWGAGHFDPEERAFTRSLQPHYFLTPPDEFVAGHFPEDDRWQLLDRPLPRTEYEGTAYLRPQYFASGLTDPSHRSSVIDTGSQLAVTFAAPDGVALLGSLRHMSGADIPRNTLSQRDPETGRFSIQAVFPGAGEYELSVFAADVSADAHSTLTYHIVTRYRVRATAGEHRRAEFPVAMGAFALRGATVYSPLEGDLKPGSAVVFRLRVPGAEKVSVITGGAWTELRRSGDLFEGEVKVKRGEVSVVFQEPGAETSWPVLLQYR